jgi:hypothetical protein
MFRVEYVTPTHKLTTQTRASFTGAHTLAKILKRKGCVSVSISDPTGNEVYRL